MAPIATLLSALVAMVLGALPAVAQERPDWTGEWQTYWRGGLATMTLEQDGDRVTGTYQPDDGELEGRLEDGVLRGTWREPGASGGFVFALSDDGQTFTGRFENGEYWNGRRAAAEDTAAVHGQPLRSSTPEQTLRSILVRANAAVHAGNAAALRDAERLMVYAGEEAGTEDVGDHDARRSVLWSILDLSTMRLVTAPDGATEPDGETATYTISPLQSSQSYTLTFRRDPPFGWVLVVDPLETLEATRERFLRSMGYESLAAFENANTTSPRQAMFQFLTATSNWDEGGREAGLAVMDLSAIPERMRAVEGELLADYLWAVISRVGFIIRQEIPNLQNLAEPYVFYSHPEGDVVLDSHTDPETGAVTWRFTSETLADIPRLYLAMQELPVAEGVGGHEPLSDFFRLRERIRDRAPGLLQRTLLLERWQWLGLFVTVLAAAIAAWTAGRVGNAAVAFALRPGGTNGEEGPSLRRPLAWFTFLLLMLLAYSRLGLSQGGAEFAGRALAVGVVVTAGWLAFRLVGGIGDRVYERAQMTSSAVDEIVTSLVVGLIKVLAIIVTIIAAADVVGLPYEGVLTGLGIGGVALAFAARETVSNLLGGAILLADRPFKRGDLIDVGGHFATIEEVGLRSTRLRTLDDSLLVMPNSKLSDQAISNWGSRRNRKVQMLIGLTYDTPPDKLDAFCRELVKVYKAQPRTDDEAVYIGVKSFGPSSIDIELWGYFTVRSYDAQVDAQHRLMLDIIRLVQRLEVSFAFPTRTVHVAPSDTASGETARAAPPAGHAAQ